MKWQFLLLCLLLAPSVEATDFSVGALSNSCNDYGPSNEPGAGALACLSYVRGFAEGHAYSGGRIYCLPTGVTFEQLILVFRKWAAANPEDHHMPAAAGLARSIRLAFPCDTESRSG